jgi:hypothetical protein
MFTEHKKGFSMFFWIAGLIVIVVMAFVHWLYRRNNARPDYYGTTYTPGLGFGRWTLTVIGWISICVIIQLICYGVMISYIANLHQCDLTIEQRIGVVDTRVPMIKDMLINDYPKYERNLLLNFKDLNMTILRNVDAMSTCAAEIDKSTEWVQSAREWHNKIERDISVMRRSPFIIPRFLPKE